VSSATEPQFVKTETKTRIGEETDGKLVAKQVVVRLSKPDESVAFAGICASSIQKYCKDVEAGESRLTNCIFREMVEENKGNSDGEIPKECKKEVKSFLKKRSSNINQDPVLARACKEDANKFCKDLSMATEPGKIITCLMDKKEDLMPKCKKVIVQRQIDATRTVDADAPLLEDCKEDLDTICADITEKRRQCLMDNRARVSWTCQSRLFKENAERSDDWRLSARLFQSCYNDKMRFCKDVEAGGSKVKDCLEDNREKSGFSPVCKEQVDKMIQARSQNFMLDYDIKTGCKEDIEKLCQYEKDIAKDLQTDDASVINCLQDFRDELVTNACKKQVHKTIQRDATDIRFNAPLSNACVDDRTTFCKDVPPGDARVIRCLQDNRASLSFSCRATLFDQEVMMAESIDFQVPLKKACEGVLKKHCAEIEHTHGLAIECLLDHTDDETATTECKREIKRLQLKSSEDYRLNYRLQRACELDVDQLCPDACDKFSYDVCGGKVYQCLSDKESKIQNEACKKELFRYQQQETKDYQLDKPLADKCKADVEKFCSNLPKGDDSGRVHECLYEHIKELSDECRIEEQKIQKLKAKDVRLQPGVMQSCSEEIAMVCKGIKPGNGRILDCLIANLESSDYSPACEEKTKKILQKQEKDFSLNFQLATSCKKNAEELCADKQGKGHRDAAVLTCLVENESSLDDTCSTQVSKLLRNALWAYRQGAMLTSACDADANICKSQLKRPGKVGKIGLCLSQKVLNGKDMNADCKKLVVLAAPSESKAIFEENLTKTDIMEKLASFQKAAVEMTSNGLKLTGWVAFAGIGALAVVLVAGGYFLYQRYYGKHRKYTMVMKQGDV